MATSNPVVASDNTVGGTTEEDDFGNIIVFNGSHGVFVGGGTGNTIRHNSIHSNRGLGIDLRGDGPTPNDVGDGDAGANRLQNFPTLSLLSPGGTSFEVTINSSPNADFQIDFYSNRGCDSSGHGEGAKLLDLIDVRTDSAGIGRFQVSLFDVFIFSNIVATATDADGNTSEFSPCVGPMVGNGDINGDGQTATDDFLMTFVELGSDSPSTLLIDVNGDGAVDVLDGAVVALNFGRGVGGP